MHIKGPTKCLLIMIWCILVIIYNSKICTCLYSFKSPKRRIKPLRLEFTMVVTTRAKEQVKMSRKTMVPHGTKANMGNERGGRQQKPWVPCRSNFKKCKAMILKCHSLMEMVKQLQFYQDLSVSTFSFISIPKGDHVALLSCHGN